MSENKGYLKSDFWHSNWTALMDSYLIYICVYMLTDLVSREAAKGCKPFFWSFTASFLSLSVSLSPHTHRRHKQFVLNIRFVLVIPSDTQHIFHSLTIKKTDNFPIFISDHLRNHFSVFGVSQAQLVLEYRTFECSSPTYGKHCNVLNRN